MKFALYTNSISAHQLPLAREIVKRVGAGNFRYIYTGGKLQGGGQEVASSEPWIVKKEDHSTVHLKPSPSPQSSPDDWLETCDVLLSGNRDVGLFERRCAAGRKTYYMSERWFKPILIKLPVPHFFTFHFYFSLPGALRLLHPRYFKMAKRLVGLLGGPGFIYLPIGVHAARDMARLYGLLHGDLRCLFRAPSVSFDRQPMGAIANYPWMKMWGYFVEKGIGNREQGIGEDGRALRVLWVGRMLKLKNVDVIIRAFQNLDSEKFELTLVGDGPERGRLVRMAQGMNNVRFRESVPIEKVRALMREHDVFVFPSNGYDGWGAVVSEALEEGMCVLGSYESGAPATMLPQSQLFHCSDWRSLRRLLVSRNFKSNAIGRWTSSCAARSFVRGEVP